MSNELTSRLHQVKDYFDQGDRGLGQRRLLDAALDTDDPHIFEDLLFYLDRIEKEGFDGSTEASDVSPLLQKIAQVPQSKIMQAGAVVLQANDVTKSYISGKFRLGPVSMQVRAGEVVGLVGENGNGKTTLLRLLAGELGPESGFIRYFEGEELSDRYSLRSRIAYLPQRHSVWHGSLRQNLQFTAAHYGRRGKANRLFVEIIMARMGLRAFRDHSWSAISSGYKTRFELARTLLRNPAVLLLDEPLANLDLKSQQVILEDLKFLATSIARPMAVVLSSQQLYEVEKISENVLFLQQGSPRWKLKTAQYTDRSELVIELDSSMDRASLKALLQELSPSQLSYNGGVYLIHFDGLSFGQVISHLGKAECPMRYVRDITHSSRRFFDQ